MLSKNVSIKALMLLLVVVVVAQLTQSMSIDDIQFHTPEQLNVRRSSMLRSEWSVPEGKEGPEEEKDPSFWIDTAHRDIRERLRQPNLNKAKNIIMFLGDGMSLNTLTAARILKGQREGKPGEESNINFQQFPAAALSKTYCTNAQVADSACTATAYLCGVKTNIGMLGVSSKVGYNNCTASMDRVNHVSSLADWAQAAGKSTGIVTTTTLTHASPSGAYAHSASRFFESDSDILKWAPDVDIAKCKDIASQLVTDAPGRNFQVMFGGGSGKFLPKTMKDAQGNDGERGDGKNLLYTWQTMHPQGAIVTNRDQLLSLNVSKVSNIMGLFQKGVMSYHLLSDLQKQPTLEEMTEVAIKMLSKNKNGFFVFIEGGLIDYGNHQTMPGISLDETLEMEKAVQKALDMTDERETLIVVTSDHAHPLSISGYPARGNDILGLNENDVDKDGTPYTTLNYAIGTHQYLDEQGKRLDLTGHFTEPNIPFPSQIPADIGVHAGDDVGIFASGPQSHLFSGVMQQSNIPHIMAYAACIGKGPKMCDNN